MMKTQLTKPVSIVGLALVMLALGFLAATGARSLLVGKASAQPAAPNPGHGYDQVGLPEGTWLGLDADKLDGLDSTAFSSPAWSAVISKPAGFADDIDNDVVGGLSCNVGQIAKWNGVAWVCAADSADSIAWSVVTGKPAGFADDIDDDILGDLSCSNGQIVRWDGSAWQCAWGDGGTGGSWLLAGNGGTVPGTDFLGTTDNQALELEVNGTRALRLEPNATSPNVVGGYEGNSVTAGVAGAAVSGGGLLDGDNVVTDNFGTVGGGQGNQAGDGTGTTSNRPSATVAGGHDNTASGNDSAVGGGFGNLSSNQSATVSGGSLNTASGMASVVSGGGMNEASGDNATVAGGWGNIASQNSATVGGGAYNLAAAFTAYAAGYRAKANNTGCWVWGDATGADVACNTMNRFIARASGGVYFYTTGDLSTGSYLAAGSGSWSSVSSRDVKENFTAVDGQEVLARLSEVPVATWNYRTQEENVRHMGPMAQDFYDAFGLGESDTAISTVDADGVALAAIQGLYELVQQKDAEIADLNERVAELEAEDTASALASESSSSGPPMSWLAGGGGVLVALVLVQHTLAARRRRSA